MNIMKQKLSNLWQQLLTHINHLMHGHTIAEIIEHEYSAAFNTVSECHIAIQRHEYIKHMAKAKINAIDDWNAGNIL